MRATTTNGTRRTAFLGRGAAAFGLTVVAGFGLLPALAAPATAASAPTPATIQNFSFSPNPLKITVGTTVQWTNNGPSQHTVTADDGSFSSQHLNPGDTFSFTFNVAKQYTYHCAIHPSMMATVDVQPAATTTTTAPTTTTTAAPTTTTAPVTPTTAAPRPSTTTTAPRRTTTTTRPAAPSTTGATAASTTTTAPPASPTDTAAPAGTTPSTEVANGVAAGPGSGGHGGSGGGRAAAVVLGAAGIAAVSGGGWWTLRRRRSAA